MHSIRRLPVLAFLALGLLATPIARAADTYPVNLTPKWVVGQTFDVSSSVTESTRMSMTVGGQVANEQSRKRVVRFEADAEALKVHPNGGLRQASYTVRSLRMSENAAAETDFLPKGTKLVVEQTGPSDKSVTVNGKAASPEQLAVVKSLLNSDGEQHNDQLIFGPAKPVAVGETWAINSASLISSLGQELGEIGAARGTMKLDAYTGEGAKGVAKVSGQATIILKTTALPEGFTLKSGRMTLKLDGKIPATRAGSQRDESMSGNFELVGEAPIPNGGVAQLRVVSEMVTESVYRFR